MCVCLPLDKHKKESRPPWSWSLSNNQVKEGETPSVIKRIIRCRGRELIFILQLRQAQESSTLCNIPANEADFQMSSQQQASLRQDGNARAY